MRAYSFLCGFVLVVPVTLAACSDDTPAGSASDAGASSSSSSGGSSSTSSSGSGTHASGDDAGAITAVNECTTFEDLSSVDMPRSLQWDLDVGTRKERCMQIRAGQKVRFSADGGQTPADFSMHPLLAQGGDTPNPIADVDTTTGEVTFPAPGIFGFACGIHATMTGAIKVAP
jgi:plastocyanin